MAATSVGKLGTDILLDLNYEEDSKADVDMNIVKTGAGRFVEIQGTAEDGSFSEDEMKALMAAAHKGTQELIAMQRAVLGDVTLKKPKPEPDDGLAWPPPPRRYCSSNTTETVNAISSAPDSTGAASEPGPSPRAGTSASAPAAWPLRLR